MTEQPAERPKRLRKIVKWLTLSVGAVVLLLASYIALWCFWWWNHSVTSTSDTATRPIIRSIPDWVFRPLKEYAVSDLPGNESLLTLELWSGSGGTKSWAESSETAVFIKNLADFKKTVEAMQNEPRPLHSPTDH